MATSGNWWNGLIDDAAVLPPGDADLDVAIRDHVGREAAAAALVRSLAVRDTDLPGLAGFTGPITIVLTGGAGQVDGAMRKAGSLGLRVIGLETALRDLDDLAGNARRVTTALEVAQDEGLLAEETAVRVELPPRPVDHGWLAAADEIAAIELGLTFRLGGAQRLDVPDAHLASWVDAALDRELPFTMAGLQRAVRHRTDDGIDQHGFLNLALATLLLFDGDPDGGRVLAERDPDVLVDLARQHDLTRARRWFTGFGSPSVREAYADLVALGLIAPPEPAAGP